MWFISLLLADMWHCYGLLLAQIWQTGAVHTSAIIPCHMWTRSSFLMCQMWARSSFHMCQMWAGTGPTICCYLGMGVSQLCRNVGSWKAQIYSVSSGLKSQTCVEQQYIDIFCLICSTQPHNLVSVKTFSMFSTSNI